MASNTTYGDWMRPIRGGIRNIGRPLTMIGFGVLAVTLMLSMANVVAALVFGVVGLGIVMVLAVRDRQHRNVLDRTVERRAHVASVRSGRALYRSGLLSFEEHGSCLLPGILHKVSLVEASDGVRSQAYVRPSRAYRRIQPDHGLSAAGRGLGGR